MADVRTKLEMLKAASESARARKSSVPAQETTGQKSNKTPGHNRKLFQAVENTTPPGKNIPKEWNDSRELPNIPIYELSQLTSEEAVLLGGHLLHALRGRKVNKDHLDIILHLAVSIKDTANPELCMLSAPATGFGKKTALSKPSSPEDRVSNDEETRTNQERLKKLAEEAAKLSGKAQDIADKQTSDDTVKEQDKSSIHNNAAAYCYIAAYLLRLQSKQEDSFVLSLDKMKIRFKGWYEGGEQIVDKFSLTTDMAKNIKEVMGRRDEIIGTWVMWMAYNENEKSLSRSNSGLMQYLAGQIFQYTGMHAATQILTIVQETKVPLDFLLGELNHKLTRHAILAFYHMIQTHEIVKEKPGRKTYFRYSRIWDSGYFSELQTKNCASLVYLVAKIVKLISPSGATSDPTLIFGIKDMGEEIKNKLDIVASKISKLILEYGQDDEETGSAW